MEMIFKSRLRTSSRFFLSATDKDRRDLRGFVPFDNAHKTIHSFSVYSIDCECCSGCSVRGTFWLFLYIDFRMRTKRRKTKGNGASPVEIENILIVFRREMEASQKTRIKGKYGFDGKKRCQRTDPILMSIILDEIAKSKWSTDWLQPIPSNVRMHKLVKKLCPLNENAKWFVIDIVLLQYGIFSTI